MTYVRPKSPKGKIQQVKFQASPNEKLLLLRLTRKLETSQAEIFRQGLVYLAHIHGIEFDGDSPLYK